MTNIDISLWVLFAISAAIYWWVGKVHISQPKSNHPWVFSNPTWAKLLLTAPQAGFLLTVVGGFFDTENGWWYLGAVVLAIITLSSRPSGVQKMRSEANEAGQLTDQKLQGLLAAALGSLEPMERSAPRTDFLKALDHLAYLLECAALDYTGELKTELSSLCNMIEEKAPGYEAPVIQASLSKLTIARESYNSHQNQVGASTLSSVSREWWAVVKP